MSVINTNVKALIAQSALKINDRSLTAAMEQLSSGKRINSAKDDAAGLAISTRMTQQIRSLDQAVRNAGDAITLIQTTEGATEEITNMLQRMRELAIQAINDTNANEQRSYLDLEFQQLKKEIVRIADTTEWNGFAVLNGTAGERVGPVPVYKTTGNGVFDGGIAYQAGSVTSTNNGTFTVGGTGAIAKAGSMAITVTSGTVATAKLTLNDGTTATLSGTVAGKVITFTDSVLTDGKGTFKLTTAGNNWVANDTASFSIQRSLPNLPVMQANDVLINGVTIPGAYAVNDTKSPAGNAAASAIARVYAINERTDQTGVKAVVGQAVMTGAAMAGDAVRTGVSVGTVTINGYTSPKITTIENNTRASREAVVEAVNRMTALTGVKAVDTGDDAKGIRLEAADGRNIEVAFNTTSSAADFAARTGLKQGIQTATYSLESKVEAPVKLETTSTGKITRTGLRAGDFTVNQSVVSTDARASVTAAVAQVNSIALAGPIVTGDKFTVTLNGKPISYTATANTVENVRAGLISAINADQTLDLSAVAGRNKGEILITAGTPGTAYTISTATASASGTISDALVTANVQADSRQLKSGDLVINGVDIPASTDSSDTRTDTTASSSAANASAIAIATAINSQTIKTGVVAKANAVTTSGSVTSTLVPVSGPQSLYINGVGVTVDFAQNELASDRRAKVMNAINLQSPQHGVTATDNGDGLTLTAADGRNVAVWFDSSVQDLSAASFGLGSTGAVKQESSITFGGTVEYGDASKITVNGVEIEIDPAPAQAPKPASVTLTQSGTLTAGDIYEVELDDGNGSTLTLTGAAVANPPTAGEGLKSLQDALAAEADPKGYRMSLVNGELTITRDDGRNFTAKLGGNNVATGTLTQNVSNAVLTSTAVTTANGATSPATPSLVTLAESGVLTAGDVYAIELDDGNGNALSIVPSAVGAGPAAGDGVKTVLDAFNALSDRKGYSMEVVNGDLKIRRYDGVNFTLALGAAAGSNAGTLDEDVTSGGAALTTTAVETTSGQPVSSPALLAQAMKEAIDRKLADGSLTNLEVVRSGAALTVRSSIAGSPFEIVGATADAAGTIQIATVTANSQGNNDVTGIRDATANSRGAKTLYGSVSLYSNSEERFTVAAGRRGFGAESNFTALGFVEGTFGGKSEIEMSPPRVGRLTFQVGAAANQTITIDLSDFGKGGPITGDITGDADAEIPTITISSKDAANEVLQKLDSAMDKVNATRSTMGAVMNRLEHTINNLTNVSTNSAASRSQIEDADYAKASSDLARAQIIQQAATAVLAQANTSQQSVLKLLQG